MKKLIGVVLFLVASTAEAEYIPDGCYISFANPYQCWTAVDNLYPWIHYQNRWDTASHYGYAVETVIDEEADCLDTLNISINSFNNCYTAYRASQKVVRTRNNIIKIGRAHV